MRSLLNCRRIFVRFGLRSNGWTDSIVWYYGRFADSRVFASRTSLILSGCNWRNASVAREVCKLATKLHCWRRTTIDTKDQSRLNRRSVRAVRRLPRCLPCVSPNTRSVLDDLRDFSTDPHISSLILQSRTAPTRI